MYREDCMSENKVLNKIEDYLDQLNIREQDDKSSEAYQAYFKKILKKYGEDEPDKLSDEDKKKFFDEVDAGWKAKKETD